MRAHQLENLDTTNQQKKICQITLCPMHELPIEGVGSTKIIRSRHYIDKTDFLDLKKTFA